MYPLRRRATTMAMTTQKRIKAFRYTLQGTINPEDREWSYTIANLPAAAAVNSANLVKAVRFVSNDNENNVTLMLENASPNRAITSGTLDQFILVSFSDFRLRCRSKEEPRVSQRATPKESADYMVRLLQTGIRLNGTHYNFFGHSNSQLKSRTCFLFAGPADDISRIVESWGDFSSIKSVAKKAKRIGLLFSAAEATIQLQPERCEDISDKQTKDYNFTDGCGLISNHLAKQLVKHIPITFRNRKYTPSVFQIRYRGYKGVLTLEPSMTGKIMAKFRDSMRKFRGGEDFSFSVVDYSKVCSIRTLICPQLLTRRVWLSLTHLAI